MYEFLDTYFNGWQAETAGVIVSIVAASFILPRVFEWRQLRKLVHARAILISRADALHQDIADYAQMVASKTPGSATEARTRVLSSLGKFMNVPTEFSPIMRGNIGKSYFAYRLEATWLLGTLANANNDYQSGFDQILPAEPPQHDRSNAVSTADNLYRALHRTTGQDARDVPNWRMIKNGWEADQISAVETALKN